MRRGTGRRHRRGRWTRATAARAAHDRRGGRLWAGGLAGVRARREARVGDVERRVTAVASDPRFAPWTD